MELGKRKLTTALLAAAAITTGAASAHATFLPTPSYTETGDAGQTLATAQAAGAFPGGASTISGTIAPNGNDADLYSFTLSATTNLQFALTSTTNGIDTGLFLFNSTGQALFANNDSSGTSINPLLRATLTAGTYFLGIAISGNEPVNSANQLLFAMGGTTSTRGAASGVNPTTLAGFNSNADFPGDTGAYNIAITVVPEPSTNVALALGGAVALTLVRRFRRQAQA